MVIEAFGSHVLIFLVGHSYLSAHVENLVDIKLETINACVAMNWTMHSRYGHHSRFHRSHKVEGFM